MRLRPKKNVKLAVYSQDLIILDLEKNSYSIVKDVGVDQLTSTLNGNQHSTLGNLLLAANVLEVSESLIDLEVSSVQPKGFYEERWMTPLLSPFVSAGIVSKFHACASLMIAGHAIKRNGFLGVRRLLMKPRPRAPVVNHQEVLKSIQAINSVFFLDLSRNKCLTYSTALALDLKNKFAGVNLVIGAKTRPFSSHAWVEVNGKVVNDDCALREKLAVILEI